MQPSRTTRTLAWLSPLLVGWVWVATLAHQADPSAITRAHDLFPWMLLATYLLVLGWSVSVQVPRRQGIFRWATSTFSLVVILCCLELPAWLNLLDWRLVFQPVVGQGSVNQEYGTRFVLDRELGHRRPPLAAWSGLATGDIESGWLARPASQTTLTFHYDQWGYRNPSREGPVYAALIGDSFVEGWYVSDDQTAARVLESRMAQPVANLGVAGYGSIQGLRVLKREAGRLRPKVVVWFFFEGNDLYDDQEFENTLQYISSDSGKDYADGKPLTYRQDSWGPSFSRNALRVLRRWSDPVFPNRVPYHGSLVSGPGIGQQVLFADYAEVRWAEWIEERWHTARASFTEGFEFCKGQDINLLLCYVPIKFRVYQRFVEFPSGSRCNEWEVWPLPQKFESFCRASGIPYLDLTIPLQAALRDGTMTYALRDSHWDATGHTVVADLIQGELSRLGWLPSHAASGRPESDSR